jgi:hypothetical protein
MDMASRVRWSEAKEGALVKERPTPSFKGEFPLSRGRGANPKRRAQIPMGKREL